MDYLNKKLNTLTAETLSGMANRIQMKTRRRSRESREQQRQEAPIGETLVQASEKNVHLYGERDGDAIYYPNVGIAFGAGETRVRGGVRPPPIGFNLQKENPNANEQQLKREVEVDDTNSNDNSASKPQQPPQTYPRFESSESLYEGDAWTRLWFQRVMILTFLRMILFIRKIYEDYNATKLYSITGQTGHLFISALTLFLPTIVFTIYRITRYLQLALPIIDLKKLSLKPSEISESDRSKDHRANLAGGNDREEDQLRRALMSQSPVGGAQSPISTARITTEDQDGLVTARQTPTQLDNEQFHDTQTGVLEVEASVAPTTTAPPVSVSSSSPAPSTATTVTQANLKASQGLMLTRSSTPVSRRKQQEELEFKEKVKIDKLGQLPDRETTRVFIGASEQLLHGIMFIFWQLKRQVDVLAYLIERSCLWRRPSQYEQQEVSRLSTGSDGLEWFQDFYAAFLAILVQVYTLGLHWNSNESLVTASTVQNLNAALGSSGQTIGTLQAPDGAISQAGQTLSQAIGQINPAGVLSGRDLLIVSQLIVSSAVVSSLLVAVRRRDDGPLTLGLSMLGWGSLFGARIVVIALAFVHIGWQIMLPLVVSHVLGITLWIYNIAIDSHNEKPGESEESEWDEVDLGNGDQVLPPEPATSGSAIELEAGLRKTSTAPDDPSATSNIKVTSLWSYTQHIILVSQIFTLFAIPSLFYWPIMFNLKLHLRPLKYLVLILSENFILIPAIWFSIAESNATAGQWYLLGSVGLSSVMGFLFIYMYICCKPNLTEYFARSDELYNEAETSGIYFEFCARVFKLPDLSKHSFQRLTDQKEVIEEIQVVEESS